MRSNSAFRSRRLCSILLSSTLRSFKAASLASISLSTEASRFRSFLVSLFVSLIASLTSACLFSKAAVRSANTCSRFSSWFHSSSTDARSSTRASDSFRIASRCSSMLSANARSSSDRLSSSASRFLMDSWRRSNSARPIETLFSIAATSSTRSSIQARCSSSSLWNCLTAASRSFKSSSNSFNLVSAASASSSRLATSPYRRKRALSLSSNSRCLSTSAASLLS
mmetsp:Transcript_8301/g.16888  ORF Transcript_8301/g.16888 Transcript_8301/m.16888 type:complete len:225 (-) Transcript_8301:42-716(-)